MELHQQRHYLGVLKAPNGFILAPGEYFCRCPYEDVHIVVNTRLSSHLARCRRNYIKKVQQAGETVEYVTCPFNYSHKIIAVERDYHEDTCAFRDYTGINLRVEPKPKPKPKQKPKIKIPEEYAQCSESEPTKSSSRPKQQSLRRLVLQKSMMKSFGEAVSDQDKSLTKSFTENVLFRHANRVERNRLFGNTILEEGEYPAPISRQSLQEYLVNVRKSLAESGMTDDEFEDWDMEARLFPVRPYDPIAAMEKSCRYLYLKPPPNLSKGDRKAWLKEQQAKAPRLYDPNDPDFQDPNFAPPDSESGQSGE